jgi:hypothetical protein
LSESLRGGAVTPRDMEVQRRDHKSLPDSNGSCSTEKFHLCLKTFSSYARSLACPG